MMFETMHRADRYPPLYRTNPELGREAVQVALFNEARPSAWDQVYAYLEAHGTIGNAEVRSILGTEDTVRASKHLRAWVDRGQLVAVDPSSAKSRRRYQRPDRGTGQIPISFPPGK